MGNTFTSWSPCLPVLQHQPGISTSTWHHRNQVAQPPATNSPRGPAPLRSTTGMRCSARCATATTSATPAAQLRGESWATAEAGGATAAGACVLIAHGPVLRGLAKGEHSTPRRHRTRPADKPGETTGALAPRKAHRPSLQVPLQVSRNRARVSCRRPRRCGNPAARPRSPENTTPKYLYSATHSKGAPPHIPTGPGAPAAGPVRNTMTRVLALLTAMPKAVRCVCATSMRRCRLSAVEASRHKSSA
jgi:hypothetical protein